MRLDPDIAQELWEAASKYAHHHSLSSRQRLLTALRRAEDNDEINRSFVANSAPCPGGYGR